MSLSPIERQGESGAGARDGRGRGVREWLARLVSRVADRVRGCLTNAATDDGVAPASTHSDRSQETGNTQSPQGGRASLESGPTGRQLPATPSAELPTRPDHEAVIEATLEGDRLRIHQPGKREAYIVSDVYERVEP
jgi:hypothetical protein